MGKLLKGHALTRFFKDIIIILNSKKIHPAYKISFWGKIRLGIKFYFNNRKIGTGTNHRIVLAMTLKILETPPEVKGDLIECGTWKGATAANLSIVCKMVGRKLKVFDSFEGLPEGKPDDREAKGYKKGEFLGTLDEVKQNITKFGSIESCEFIKGWFSGTLPKLNSPILLAYLDVDLEDSLDTCVKNIWPNLVEEGFLFIDEAVGLDYSALFFSEKWWIKNFNRTPPGIIGAGTGLSLGHYYIGPVDELKDHPKQAPSSGAYTQKKMSGYCKVSSA